MGTLKADIMPKLARETLISTTAVTSVKMNGLDEDGFCMKVNVFLSCKAVS